jgi:hypothetical protein
MASDSVQPYRIGYAKLLRLYPKPYRERFGEGMEQTFSDLLHEHAKEKQNLFLFTLWMYIDTSIGILREHLTSTCMQPLTKRLIRWAMIVACILLIPLVLTIRDGNVPNVGWNWSPGDFLFMGILLFGAATTYELIARKMNHASYRAAVALAGVTSVLLVWINGAVGLIGDGDLDSPNALYFGVLAIGFLCAVIARFEARGMARALFVTAFAQFLVPIIVLLTWGTNINWAPGMLQVFILNGFFASLFLGSGLLFQQASQKSKA